VIPIGARAAAWVDKYLQNPGRVGCRRRRGLVPLRLRRAGDTHTSPSACAATCTSPASKKARRLSSAASRLPRRTAGETVPTRVLSRLCSSRESGHHADLHPLRSRSCARIRCHASGKTASSSKKAAARNLPPLIDTCHVERGYAKATERAYQHNAQSLYAVRVPRTVRRCRGRIICTMWKAPPRKEKPCRVAAARVL